MTIATEITRIKTNIENAYTALEEKGATMPEIMNSNNLAETVGSVVTGGGNSGTLRSGWNVPQLYLDIDNAVADEANEVYQNCLEYYQLRNGNETNMPIMGFTFKGVANLKIMFNAMFRPYAIKDAKGNIWYHKDINAENGYNTTVEILFDNSNNDNYIIGYFQSLPDIGSTNKCFEINYPEYDSSYRNLNQHCKYMAFKNDMPYNGGNIGNLIESTSLESFNIIGELADNEKYFGLGGLDRNSNWKYFPPLNIWCSKTQLYDINSDTFNFFSHLPYNFPDGLDLSNYTSTSTLIIGYKGGAVYYAITRNSNLNRMMVTLPSTCDVTFI